MQKSLGGRSLCLFCTIWHERNTMTFENEAFSGHKMKATFVSNLWSHPMCIVWMETDLLNGFF